MTPPLRAHDKIPQQPKAIRPTGRTWEETVPLDRQFRGRCGACLTDQNVTIVGAKIVCVDPDACCWRIAKGER
jgi:hypothetical protein